MGNGSRIRGKRGRPESLSEIEVGKQERKILLGGSGSEQKRANEGH